MKEIAPGILIETGYEGVTLGAICTEFGALMIDTPLNPKDTMAWRTICARSSGGSDRLLVLLDEHNDRLSGAGGVKCPIIVHERTAQWLVSRSQTLRAAGVSTEMEWEEITEPVNTRGIHAEITFTKSMTIHWGDEPVLLEHHPGPSRGNTWVIVPEKQVAFIGDTVTPGLPPFLSNADFKAWLEALHELQLARFNEYFLISGRDELVNKEDIKHLERFLKKASREIDLITRGKTKTDEVEKLAEELASDFNIRTRREAEQIKNRLIADISEYLSNHSQKSPNND